MGALSIASSARQLMDAAQRETRIDIDDTAAAERLDRLLHSLNHDAQLSASGAAGIEKRLLRLLRNRLRMLRDLARHPEIHTQEVVRPLFLTGTARTGSTKLHKALAASGSFIPLIAWQGHTLSLRTGDRGEDPSPRIRETAADYDWFNNRVPEAKLAHFYQPLETEEETIVLEHCFYGPFMAALAFVPQYLQWYMTQDPRSDFEFLKTALKYLQWQFHDADRRPWVLKCPGYPGLEPVIAQAFPDAIFATTNRHPASAMSSGASLWFLYHRIYSDVDRKLTLGPILLEGMATGIERQMAIRDAHPFNVLDIGYTEITRNIEQAVEKIHAHTGLDFPVHARDAVRIWDSDNVQNKQGVHQHNLEEFGLSRGSVERRFAAYIARFRDYF